jgi:hypothetical protein
MTYDDLPEWMQRSRREVDWAFWVIVVACVVVVWPLLTRVGLPRGTDIQGQLARTIEVAESIQAGILYPRWAPDFNYGYGSPLWNYLAPLSHYLTGLHYVLAQSSPETSIKFVLVCGIGLAGLGMFSFVRRRWGTYAGILAALVYLYSPQLALVQPYLQGDLGGVLAAGLFPAALWAFDRVLLTDRGWDILLASLLLAALWLADTPLNVLLVSILVGWLVWRRVVLRTAVGGWQRALLAWGFGTALPAFYWLPAWAEHHAVTWRSVAAPPVDAAASLSLPDMLAPPGRLDLSAINPAQTHSVGFAVWTLTVIALVLVLGWAWRHTPPHPQPGVARGDAFQWRIAHLLSAISQEEREALYFVGVGIVLFVLAMPPARPIWDALPGWPLFYPRDLLPVLAACGAVGAAQLGRFLEARRPGIGAAGMAACLLWVLIWALPVLCLPTWQETHPVPDLSAVLREEARGHMAASLTTGWLLPQDVAGIPNPSLLLIASYQDGAVDKVARDMLPASTQVDIVEHTPQLERLVVRSANPVIIPLLTYYFPGWRARIDGQPAEVTGNSETGLITFALPAGRHEVVVYFGSTSARSIAWGLSGLSLVLMLIISLRLEYRSTSRSGGVEPLPPVGERPVLLVAGIMSILAGLVAQLAPGAFTVQSQPGVVLSAQNQHPLALQGGIDLLAYDVGESDNIRAGGELPVTLYWRAIRPDLPDYQVNVSIAAEDDPSQRISFVQHRHPGMIPSSQWPTWPLLDYYLRDDYSLPLDQDIAPGTYNVMVQVGSCSQMIISPCETMEPLFVRDGRGTSLGRRITLPIKITVRP